MLARKTFTPTEIANARADVDAALAAYDALPDGPARSTLEPLLFDNLLLALEARFVHRQRGLERKADNPLSATRRRCEAIIAHEAEPLTRAAFTAQADAFLAELTERFSE